MHLSEDQVRHIAKLARIRLRDDEIQKFQTELSAILDYVEELNEVDTTNVIPTSQVTGLENHMREDKVTYEFSRETMLESAIETAEDHLKVKGIFPTDSTESK
jgi:aspartyl-tRNA(Asn)/glutamyl-tRNA(Gln) amidotransferase subunit C